MRKALLIGIDQYDNKDVGNLNGCKKDVDKLEKLLSYHYGNNEVAARPNFNCKTLKSSDTKKEKITRRKLRKEIKNFFEDDQADIALLYFSGHGYENSLGGYLVTQDASLYEEGMSFNDIMIYANNSTIKEIVIILDCCQSGHLGEVPTANNHTVTLREGISILTSSTATQKSWENGVGGVFTGLLCNALGGGNADVLGCVTVAHLYEHAEKLLGPWEQRPIFRTNSCRLTILRNAEPRIEFNILKKITTYFKGVDYSYKLDPAYEYTKDLGDKKKEKIFKHLQRMAGQGLVKPMDAEFMYFAAIESKYCVLTEFGKQYYRLIEKKLLKSV